VAMTAGWDDDWFVREVVLYWKRTLKRLDRSGTSIITLVEPGSCFVGTLFELALSADRVYMVDGSDAEDSGVSPAQVFLTPMNFGPLPRANGLTRLQTRFLGQRNYVEAMARRVGDPIAATEAVELGLATGAVPGSEWEPTIRRAMEEWAKFTPASLGALRAQVRSGGPETLETKLFAHRIGRQD
jgi:benzoyl-CoA-dihydrodiol lyase